LKTVDFVFILFLFYFYFYLRLRVRIRVIANVTYDCYNCHTLWQRYHTCHGHSHMIMWHIENIEDSRTIMSYNIFIYYIVFKVG